MAPSNSKKNKRKSGNSNKRNAAAPRKRQARTKEIVFDPEARRDYLRGFSERKRQRRAYGLAMQKVKDRKAKLEARKELKEAELERIQEAEQLKEKAELETLQAAANQEKNHDDDDGSVTEQQEPTPDDTNTTTTYHDKATQQQWGGDVVVTTSMALLDSDDDEQDVPQQPPARQKKQKSRDAQQEYAGNVEKFLSQLKQNMPPSKKKHATAQNKHRGKHGAAAMKGIGSTAEMKVAQKALARSKKKGGGGGGKKGKR